MSNAAIVAGFCIAKQQMVIQNTCYNNFKMNTMTQLKKNRTGYEVKRKCKQYSWDKKLVINRELSYLNLFFASTVCYY